MFWNRMSFTHVYLSFKYTLDHIYTLLIRRIFNLDVKYYCHLFPLCSLMFKSALECLDYLEYINDTLGLDIVTDIFYKPYTKKHTCFTTSIILYLGRKSYYLRSDLELKTSIVEIFFIISKSRIGQNQAETNYSSWKLSTTMKRVED